MPDAMAADEPARLNGSLNNHENDSWLRSIACVSRKESVNRIADS